MTEPPSEKERTSSMKSEGQKSTASQKSEKEKSKTGSLGRKSQSSQKSGLVVQLPPEPEEEGAPPLPDLHPPNDNVLTDFYIKIAKPLILTLPSHRDRNLAATWVKKVFQSDGDSGMRIDYMRVLMFLVSRKKLLGPFLTSPAEDSKLEPLHEAYQYQNIRKNFLALEKLSDEHNNENGSGEWPQYTSTYSSDFKEYVAMQRIPNFGSHLYFATSRDPMVNWENYENALVPKGITVEKDLWPSCQQNQAETIEAISSYVPVEELPKAVVLQRHAGDAYSIRPSLKGPRIKQGAVTSLIVGPSKSSMYFKKKPKPEEPKREYRRDYPESIVGPAGRLYERKNPSECTDSGEDEMADWKHYLAWKNKGDRRPPCWGSNLIHAKDLPGRCKLKVSKSELDFMIQTLLGGSALSDDEDADIHREIMKPKCVCTGENRDAFQQLRAVRGKNADLESRQDLTDDSLPPEPIKKSMPTASSVRFNSGGPIDRYDPPEPAVYIQGSTDNFAATQYNQTRDDYTCNPTNAWEGTNEEEGMQTMPEDEFTCGTPWTTAQIEPRVNVCKCNYADNGNTGTDKEYDDDTDLEPRTMSKVSFLDQAQEGQQRTTKLTSGAGSADRNGKPNSKWKDQIGECDPEDIQREMKTSACNVATCSSQQPAQPDQANFAAQAAPPSQISFHSQVSFAGQAGGVDYPPQINYEPPGGLSQAETPLQASTPVRGSLKHPPTSPYSTANRRPSKPIRLAYHGQKETEEYLKEARLLHRKETGFEDSVPGWQAKKGPGICQKSPCLLTKINLSPASLEKPVYFNPRAPRHICKSCPCAQETQFCESDDRQRSGMNLLESEDSSSTVAMCGSAKYSGSENTSNISFHMSGGMERHMENTQNMSQFTQNIPQHEKQTNSVTSESFLNSQVTEQNWQKTEETTENLENLKPPIFSDNSIPTDPKKKSKDQLSQVGVWCGIVCNVNVPKDKLKLPLKDKSDDNVTEDSLYEKPKAILAPEPQSGEEVRTEDTMTSFSSEESSNEETVTESLANDTEVSGDTVKNVIKKYRDKIPMAARNMGKINYPPNAVRGPDNFFVYNKTKLTKNENSNCTDRQRTDDKEKNDKMHYGPTEPNTR